MRVRAALLLAIALLLPLSGCTMFQSAAELSRQSLSGFKMRPSDYRDWNEDEDDPYAYVGEIARGARGNRALEPEPEPWLKRAFMSSKARNIERNLGFE